MRLHISRAGDRGFSLIEVIAALLVFSIITLGVGPLIISSIRGANLSRSLSVGRQLAVQSMERARGLPFHIKTTADPGDVDLLDFYFPSVPAGGTSAPFVTTCPSGTTAPACPQNIPEDYTVVFSARFAQLAVDPITGAHLTQPVPATYNSNSTTADRPPALLLELTVRSRWNIGGRGRRFELKSLLADRKFGGLKVSGFGKINYAISVQTTYQTATVQRNILALGGISESRIETRRDSRAEQTVRAASLRLVDVLNTNSADVTTPVQGATSVVVAPPDLNPSAVSAAAGTLNHPAPLSGAVGGIDVTTAGPSGGASDVRVIANADQLPEAHGGFSFIGGAGPHDFWVHKPEIGGLVGLLRLRSNDRLVYIEQPPPPVGVPAPPPVQPLGGFTNAVTTALPSGAVVTNAHVEVRDLTILPTDFGATDGVVNLLEFTADVSCRGAGPTGSPQTPQARWQASIRYWEDPPDRIGEPPVPGGYVTPILIADADSNDTLAQIKQQNPMVREFLIFSVAEEEKQINGSHPDDVHLFPVTHRHERQLGVDENGNPIIETVEHQHAGYLTDWRMRRNLTRVSQADGRSVAASIEGALGIDTVPIQVQDPTFVPTPFNISLGDLRCEAVDFR
ncbi:MAG: prepilin-type N-terminal cleavage/methylation domain-containing protein [Actinomycetota bacterium]